MATMAAACAVRLPGGLGSSWIRVPSTWSKRCHHSVGGGLRRRQAGICVAASQQGKPEEAVEGLPAEVRDDPKFVRLNDDDPRFGPTALLLVGFEQDEIPKIQRFLKDMNAEFVKLLLCTKDMVKDTLWNCMNSAQPDDDLSTVEVADGLPRICFLSGMTGEEIMTIVQTFPKAGAEDNVFAALVPKNAETVLEEVMEEVMGDHERLKKGKPSQ